MDDNILIEQIKSPVNVAETRQDIIIESSQTVVLTEMDDPLSLPVNETETVDIGMLEAYPIYYGAGDGVVLNHNVLNGREFAKQHPIYAIDGLREELDSIKALQTRYSNEYNHANYYMWQDENPEQEDRTGYFVTICDNTSQVAKCMFNPEANKLGDIFGVTVSSAAFVGGQSEPYRDHRYSIVVNSGLVPVRCESTIQIGDYVAPNNYGIARKAQHDYGYKVVALENVFGVPYAMIMMAPQGSQTYNLGTDLIAISDRMTVNEKNIVTALNLSNTAHGLATKINEAVDKSEQAIQKSEEATQKSESLESQVGNMQTSVNQAIDIANEAKYKAEQSALDAERAADEAVDKATDAVSEVNKLIDKIEPIDTWIDPTTGNTGAEYLVDYINNGVATKTEVLTATTQSEKALLASEKSALGVQTLATTISKHSVGEFSQAHRLSLDDVVSSLVVGSVYVPIDDHSESYLRDPMVEYPIEESADETGVISGGTLADVGARGILQSSATSAIELSDYTQDFVKTYYYIWNGTSWTESESPAVYFSDTYVIGTETSPYWYTYNGDVTDETTGVIYKAETLYWWQNEQWIAVATRQGNTANRMISLVYQSAKAFGVEVVNARGSLASLDVRIEDDESKIEALTLWKGETSDTLTSLKQSSNKNEANISLLAEWKSTVEEDVKNIASIQTTANENKSSIEGLTEWKGTANRSLTSLTQTSTAHEASINLLSEWKSNVEDDVSSIASIKTKADSNEANITSLTEWKGTTSSTLTTLESKANANEANISTLASWKSDVEGDVSNIAEIESKANANESSIKLLTEWKTNVEGDVSSIASIKSTAEANGASITQIVENIGSDGSVTAASIVTAVNNAGSSVKISADHINIDGILTVGNIAQKTDIPTKVSDLDNDSGFQNQTRVVSIINGTVNADYINTSVLATNSLIIKDSSNNVLFSAGNKAVSIGGWTVDYDTLKSDSFGKGIYLSSKAGFVINSGSPIYSMIGATSSINDIVFRVGKASDAVFAIDALGKMYATAGMIAGWTINTNSLTYSSYGATNHFGVYPKGVDLGNYPQPANAPSGTVWKLISGTNFGITQSGEIHSIAGKIGNVNIHPNGLSVYSRSAFTGNTGSKKSGVYITAVEDSFASFGGISLGSGDDDSGVYYDQYLYSGRHTISGYDGQRYIGIHQRASGILFFSNTSEIAPNIDNTGCVAEMNIGNDGVTLAKTWSIDSAFITSSDRNVKNTISAISDKYSVLFDNLEPVTYKYNYGTSGRLHLGFIAQSVGEAMDKANVSSDEFAALCIANRDTEDALWGLRYEEFVALNTYEIQKLKARVAELEALVARLT